MNTKSKRDYMKNLNMLILANINYIKKRLAVFPIKTVKKLDRIELTNNITIQGNDYDSSELRQLVEKKYRELLKETKASSYSTIVRNFKSDIKNENPDDIWKKYQAELRERLQHDKNELYFCLDAIKILSKVMNKKDE